ncbi:MAG: hypothetical protein ABJA60_03980 [Nitrosospira sp.]
MSGIIEIVAVFISLIMLFVFVSQAKTTAAEIRLNLYNKRFDVYKSALNLYTANCWHWNNESIRPLELQFVESLKESQFLFGNDIEIYDILEKIKDCSTAITTSNKRLELENGNRNNEQITCTLHRDTFKALNEFNVYLAFLEVRIKKYLSCETIVPRYQGPFKLSDKELWTPSVAISDKTALIVCMRREAVEA